MTGRKKATPASSAADARIQELSHQISDAQKRADELRSRAKAAKAELKKARKAHKQAKKIAKDARKRVKALKLELHDSTAEAARHKRLAAAKPKKARKRAASGAWPAESVAGISSVVEPPVAIVTGPATIEEPTPAPAPGSSPAAGR